MTLDMAIKHKKEHRKKYYGDKAVDKSCRNHGNDNWSAENRQYKNKKRLACINQKLEEVEECFSIENEIPDWDFDDEE